MSDVVITLRENGPLIVSGPIKLVDHLGNAFEFAGNDKGKGNVALCRCGHSQRRPFCDGSHKTCGFMATETAPLAAPGTESTS